MPTFSTPAKSKRRQDETVTAHARRASNGRAPIEHASIRETPYANNRTPPGRLFGGEPDACHAGDFCDARLAGDEARIVPPLPGDRHGPCLGRLSSRASRQRLSLDAPYRGLTLNMCPVT